MIDLNSLSNEELRNLQRALNKEISNRNFVTKDSLMIYKRLIEIGMLDSLLKTGADSSQIRRDIMAGALADSILKLCDIVLGNYKIVNRTNKFGKVEKRLRRNGGELNQNLSHEYVIMTNEILGVIEKHFKTEEH